MESGNRKTSTDGKLGCDFCTVVYSKEDWADGDAHDFRISNGVLYYNDAQFGWEGIKINFCPICGRKLSL